MSNTGVKMVINFFDIHPTRRWGLCPLYLNPSGLSDMAEMVLCQFSGLGFKKLPVPSSCLLKYILLETVCWEKV